MTQSRNGPKLAIHSQKENSENQYFTDLLTLLLTAVSQQFFHMLILRSLGHEALAMRIKEVDDADFVSAMQIMDWLVVNDPRLIVLPHNVFPGACIASILAAEENTENTINLALKKSDTVQSASGRALLDRVRAPRQAYQKWLSAQPCIATEPEHDLGTKKAVRALVRKLLILMDQTMLDAFCYWHENDPAAANTSWRISGATMMYLTELAPMSGSISHANGVPVGITKASHRTDRVTLETQLIEQCTRTAKSAAFCCPEQNMTKIMSEIANDCERLVDLRRNPAADIKLGHSEVFRDFRKARHRVGLAEF
ncbi:hypothetical protein SLH49_21025 [Cognatiyoonia sp. IB215446]|uniref:hypothetical protein n=1 Tax=Cognatiyoonia sp. IB215446 TaxID=3097355 RepID=UPI002A15C2D1|nr:hypothetical protein [Cognatiyoonia sp. IB215446]MDX8350480.1 hypothetical protein [Cognatiyoonia sp. IB215446]